MATLLHLLTSSSKGAGSFKRLHNTCISIIDSLDWHIVKLTIQNNHLQPLSNKPEYNQQPQIPTYVLLIVCNVYFLHRLIQVAMNTQMNGWVPGLSNTIFFQLPNQF